MLRKLFYSKMIIGGAAFVLATTGFGQLMRPTTYSVTAGDSTLPGLIGNGISEIKGSGQEIWLGSGLGVSVTRDGGETFESFSRQFSKIGYGGESAIAQTGDTIWVASAIDSVLADGSSAQTGTGIARTTDGGHSWTFLGQPMDTLHWIYEWNEAHTAIVDSSAQKYSTIQVLGESLPAVDVVTPVKNVTFDLAWDGKRLWAASFAGGLRKSEDLGTTWERVLLPWDNQSYLNRSLLVSLQPAITADTLGDHYYALDPVVHLNHRVFSVIAWDDTIWVGTAGGINVSYDGGLSWWRRYTSRDTGISGNWVVALYRQTRADGTHVIWASTVQTVSSEKTGLGYHLEGSKDWFTPLTGQRFHNFGSRGSDIYAASDNGLFKSRDLLHFAVFPPIVSADGTAQIFSDAAYAVMVNTDGSLWVGTGDGLAISYNDGLSWNIFKAQVSAPATGDFIAFPNPFYPDLSKTRGNEGHLILQFNIKTGQPVSIKVYDWAMSLVSTVFDNQPAAYTGSKELYWTGRNTTGQRVANGTYFIQLKRGNDIKWTKVMVIN